MDVLVAYASAHGSTREIAERIAARLTAQGCQAEIRPVTQIEDVSAYDAVVLGSAVHNRLWLPEATNFVQQNLDALAQRPVWLFSVGMLGDQGSAFSPALAGLLRTLRKGRDETASFKDRIHPRGCHAFAGVIQRDHIPLTGHLIFKAMGGYYGDHRNWQEIDAWADGIVQQLPARSLA